MGNGTSIGAVRGLGSAHGGSHHWMLQRFTAIGNLLLVLWFIAALLMLPNFHFDTVTEWLTRPFPAIAMALLLISSLWHAKLGMQVMLEDYVHDAANKFACMVVLNFAAFGAGAAGLFFIARIVMAAIAHGAASEAAAALQASMGGH
jgi:succinate dehydrogenase / fumarate reductase membrane anchor subunit